MQTLGHISTVYYYSKVHEYAERLAEKMPGNLKVQFFFFFNYERLINILL